MCYQSGDRYPREDIFLHEFVHGLHLLGIASNGAIPNFDAKLRQRYNYLKSSGRLWRNTYAMSTDREYLAEGAQSYFDCNDERNPPNGIHNHVNTRAELMLYDPVLYGFLKEIFPCQNKYLKRCDAKVGEFLINHFILNCFLLLLGPVQTLNCPNICIFLNKNGNLEFINGPISVVSDAVSHYFLSLRVGWSLNTLFDLAIFF